MKGARRNKRPAYDLSDPRESDGFAGEAQQLEPLKKKTFKDLTKEFVAIGFTVRPRKGKRSVVVFLTKVDYGASCNSCPPGAHGTACVASAPLTKRKAC